MSLDGTDIISQAPDESVSVRIDTDINDYLNYASWQNSVPLIRSLEIVNPTETTYNDLVLELEITPGFARSRKWVIDRLEGKGTHLIRDRHLEMEGNYLSGLNEAERGDLIFRLKHRDELLCENRRPVRVLARDEWGGMRSMPEILAAFVMPNDPAIAGLLKASSAILAKHGHSSALDGYQSQDPGKAFLQVAALWSAVSEKNLTYANPPSSFEDVGQKVRRPSRVLKEGLATCLDSTLLFASALEAIGLHPIVIMQRGHCFAGAWLIEDTQDRLIEPDCLEVRKIRTSGELVLFETTMVTSQSVVSFDEAMQRSDYEIRESEEHKFVASIDIKRARMAQVRPLASHDSELASAEQISRVAPALPKFPGLGSPDYTINPKEDEKPTTPDSRIDRWQRKLLDLSLRNRLLNLRETQLVVPFLCKNIPLLEDRLASGTKIKLISLDEMNPHGERDSELHLQQTNRDMDEEFARIALEKNELASTLTERELSGRLTAIYRKVKNDLAEGGTNTLYLAIGFLRWRRREDESRYYKAPLMLVPVKLERKNASAGFKLTHHEEEVRFNATLIQLLKRDFEKDISQFEGELPQDENGIDVPLVMRQVRQAIRDVPGFEVIEETALSTFSFSKYLMWKDLVERLDQLKENRLIRHLVFTPEKEFSSGISSPMPRSDEMDLRYRPHDLAHPLPADSSQLAAVMAAAEGHDLVIIGPPGTGKSQTIANMIAQCLATRKTVLFVAEKTAALDVVYRRLREHGLGDLCLELHSNKAERKSFLDQLNNAWLNRAGEIQNEWDRVNDHLEQHREHLNRYVQALHRRDGSGWTPYNAMWRTGGMRLESPLNLGWPDNLQHSREEYDQLLESVERLAHTHAQVAGQVNLAAVKQNEWSIRWEQNVVDQAQTLKAQSETIQGLLHDFFDTVGIPDRSDCSLTEYEQITRLCRMLLKTAGDDFHLVFSKDFSSFGKDLESLHKTILAYSKGLSKLKGEYLEETLTEIPVEELLNLHQQAESKFWPLSIFARKKVVKQLQGHANGGTVEPAVDLEILKRLQQLRDRIFANPFVKKSPGQSVAAIDVKSLVSHLETAKKTRDSIVTLAKSLGGDSIKRLSKTLAPVLSGDATKHPVTKLASKFYKSAQEYQIHFGNWKKLAGTLPVHSSSPRFLEDTCHNLDDVLDHRAQLQSWTMWCLAEQTARKLGLQNIIPAIEGEPLDADQFRDDFESAYARWWLTKTIDNSPELRAFQREDHERKIDNFLNLDEQARGFAPIQVQQIREHDLPEQDGVPKKSELGLLRHQIKLKRPSKSIRQMISAMPDNFSKLAPCLMMSPLSIAQYLPAGQELFDVVIFDEASQITTWDAIGAIGRAKQTIIVGDPKQLPPTNFFGRSDSEEESELEDHEQDLESILDEVQTSGVKTLQLSWHYRSRHESLITFSNWHYYNNKLITFPSTATEDNAVRLVHLPESEYDRGKSRTNKIEAERIVSDAVALMKSWIHLPDEKRLTLGVITFNTQQQTLIMDLFDRERRRFPEIEWFFGDERIEPTVVKNLENVQGDERDVMFFSITFGKNASGRIPLNFGAINRVGGERRLNVAVTRAREELVVYSSFKAEDLDTQRTASVGVKHLKSFLDFAERGDIALRTANAGSVGEYESPFEQKVSEALQSRGWQTAPQIGVSGFRIDLGIIHPDKPGVYLAGVECDGATYHSSHTARDRDKTRQLVLENLGWTILRIWSPDWWYDPAGALDRIDASLKSALEKSRQEEEQKALDTMLDSAQSAAPMLYYQRASFDDLTIEPDRFYDSDYSSVLRQMIDLILSTEAPLLEDSLLKQIATAHGFGRMGAKIRERILKLLPDVSIGEEPQGRFIWSGDISDTIPYRSHYSDEDQRSLDEIPHAELKGLINAHRELLDENDPAQEYAKLLRINRLTANLRSRIEEVIGEVEKYKDE
ncbi:ATP-dependent RecD-like DNA helicase [Polystyrenella longa]|uniref:ATP-dependent RecD-like DNA helicase n=1 Tax=Polystyrenella longa TaxID=2528007 RepID=A0A518CTQ5_9PLAN|nr:DUF3320 domain-containing protein [Polystyrenella longa]QDU82606.1 ATP-dependent RecD-like DNA helicase [Polystyrenella longa]